MDEPTIDMWRALLDFRARYGRYWKRALSIKWMSGDDESEHFSASLRTLRNQFGPSWLYALKPVRLDVAGRRIALLDRLPIMCATRLIETAEAIVLKRGRGRVLAATRRLDDRALQCAVRTDAGADCRDGGWLHVRMGRPGCGSREL